MVFNKWLANEKTLFFKLAFIKFNIKTIAYSFDFKFQMTMCLYQRVLITMYFMHSIIMLPFM